MKKLVLAFFAFALITLGAGRNARAQNLDGLGWIVPIYLGVEGACGVGGVVTGIGASVSASRGEMSRGWFGSSYVFGGINTVWALYYTSAAKNDHDGLFTGLVIAHASMAVFDFVAGTVGFARGSRGPRLTPVALGGTDAGGRKWAGAGLQLSNF